MSELNAPALPGGRCCDSRSLHGALTVALVALAAWAPSLRSYVPLADDNVLAAVMQGDGLRNWMAENGIHRIGQFPVSWLLLHAPAYVPGIVALLTHALVGVLFYLACQRLLKREMVALMLAVIFAAWPAGFEAILWTNSCYPCLFSALIFWLVVLICLSTPAEIGAQIKSGAVILILVLIALPVREDFTFCYLAFPALSLCLAGESRITRLVSTMRRRPVTLAPAIAAGLFLVAFVVSRRHATSTKHTGEFHLQSLASVYLRQYTALDPARAWFSSSARAFFLWPVNAATIAAVLLAVAALVLILLPRRHPMPVEDVEPQRPGVLFFLIGLLFGGAFIYALAGGFSLDSRKKYGVLPIILLLVGWVWCILTPRRKGDALVPSAVSRLVTGTVTVICIATAWLICGIWRAEEMRMSAIVAVMRANPAVILPKIVSEPDLYNAWPQLQRNVGFRFDDLWVLNNALGTSQAGAPAGPLQTGVTIYSSISRDGARARLDR